jgi:hypothetical protein
VIGQDLAPEVIVRASRHPKSLKPRIKAAMEEEWELFSGYPAITDNELRPFVSYDQYNFVGGENYGQE